MKLKIKSIADKGDYQKERLVIKVLNDTDVGEFILLGTGFFNQQVNTSVSETFWFPDRQVEEGDLIIVYSKVGKTNEKILNTGKKAHFFYWGKDEALWNSNEKAVVLMYAPVWESNSADEL